MYTRNTQTSYRSDRQDAADTVATFVDAAFTVEQQEVLGYLVEELKALRGDLQQSRANFSVLQAQLKEVADVVRPAAEQSTIDNLLALTPDGKALLAERKQGRAA